MQQQQLPLAMRRLCWPHGRMQMLDNMGNTRDSALQTWHMETLLHVRLKRRRRQCRASNPLVLDATMGGSSWIVLHAILAHMGRERTIVQHAVLARTGG